ncbi:DUF3794 and LysM peptidoglycan-binding domain-containing protein [Anaerosalibacter sp. Marseille-P3206]|uniref:DUF3794 and LysM peptidoglycan-binding domain-containing protein n=1 Tax=Anaerosalibacter sp. Marseille-P3206 TaxID=1871005 RepID=UPI000984E00E|nr:SPOCS domain-containing protein [Anaerosalibacter sp. Marseille-P3206]
MPAELVKDILKVDEIKGSESVQTLVETEIYLNQSKPEIENILWTDGKVEIMNVKIVKDMVIVNGILILKVIYKSKDEHIPIVTTETKVDFKEEINMVGIDEEMIATVKPQIEHIEYETIEGRKIILEALINLSSKVKRINSIEIVKDIVGGDGLQTLKEKVRYNRLLGANESYAQIKEAFEIKEAMPDIEEVLKLDTNIYEQETKVVEDKIIVSGLIEAAIIYYGGEKLNTVRREVNFNHFVDVEGAVKDADCDVKLEIMDGDFEVKEDIEGNLRIIDLEVKVKVSGKVYEIEEKELVLDAYSTKKLINVTTEEIEVGENIKRLKTKEIITETFKETGFREVYNVEGVPNLLDCRIIEDKVVLEGLLSMNVLYLDSLSKEVKSIVEEIPFKTYLDVEGIDKTMKADVDIVIEKIDYKIEDENLEVEVHLQNVVSLNRTKKLNIILDLIETEEYVNKRNRPSITIYIVQKNDTLWDIAKRYNTTVEDLIISNNISSPDNLMPGEKIIIEKIIDLGF